MLISVSLVDDDDQATSMLLSAGSQYGVVSLFHFESSASLRMYALKVAG